MERPWAQDARSVLSQFGLKSLKSGLTSDQVETQRKIHGRNEIPSPAGTSLLVLILKQFEDTLVLILLAAAFVSFGLAFLEEGDDKHSAFVEPLVILLILIANATVGVMQETNAESAIEKLKESEASEALVIRDSQAPRSIASAELVPGDVIVVADGDKVPADARLMDVTSLALQADEAALTGESEAVQKVTSAIRGEQALNQDKKNMLFSGTLIVRGKGLAVVTATGSKTELGLIASSLDKKKDDDDEDDDDKTPLQKKLDKFGDDLTKVIGIICIVVWVINIGHFSDPIHNGSWIRGAIYYLKIAVSLAVAAIPEGLPAVVTTCLALGTYKMAKNGAIVRSLPSVETLGCTTVICSDKTGTLTTNKMSVQKILVLAAPVKGGRDNKIKVSEYSVTGDSWSPVGSVELKDEEELVYPACDVAALSEMSCISSLCTEATLVANREDDGSVTYGKTGPPTEAALLVMAEKIGVPEEKLMDALDRGEIDPIDRATFASNFWNAKYERVATLEFTRQRKTMSVIVREKTASATSDKALLVKGAAERVLARSTSVFVDGSVVPLTPSLRSTIEARLDEMNSQGLRCLAMAFRGITIAEQKRMDLSDPDNFEGIESDLCFIGAAGMLDPPRAPVREALSKCRDAGIRVIVITGDNRLTAEAICRRIGLFDEKEDLDGKSFTGEDVNKMTEEQFQIAVKNASLFSRVEPRHKLMIVEALKKQGETVAMTGDGVNDATALRHADIGIAMGSGTSVAKEASKMVLQDDNFATIVMAVQEGRAIFANTKQFIRYLISSNIGEVACVFGATALGIPAVLIPVQLLWVNLVTDGLPATALGFNPADPDVMKSSPRDADENIIDRWMFFRYMSIGLYVGFGTIGSFIWWYLFAERGPHITFYQLSHFTQCGTAAGAEVFKGVNCNIFDQGIAIPSTVALSVLVVIEMFNAFNALSENQSLLVVSPLSNLWVAAATTLSMILHIIVVYVPFFNDIFHLAPLNTQEWTVVVLFSLPVFLLDEILKLITRIRIANANKAKRKLKIE